MSEIVKIIGQRLSQLTVPNRDRDELAAGWINDPISLSYWDAWTLLCLIRHRERQQFVADTIRFRLNAELDVLAKAGNMGHPDCPQQGIVPGASDWEYYFHGCGCCLTRRVTGERIDVDFYDSTADWFDTFFFVNYLESLQSPAFVEQRVISLHPSYHTVVIAVDRLLDAGLLEQYEDRQSFRLTFDHEELAALLDDIDRTWQDRETQFLVASAVGDWSLLAGMQLDDRLKQIVATNLVVSCDDRSTRLVDMFRLDVRTPEALEALNDLGSPMLDNVIKEALDGPPSGATSAALAVLEKANAGKWCGQIEALLNRIDPNGDLPSPHIGLKCCELLLRNGRQAGIQEKLLSIHSHVLGDAAVLALEHLPGLAVRLFRRALRSEIPYNRITAAAALAIIDQPWCRTELVAILDESDDQLMTAECRSALMTTHSEDCHQRVRSWEELNPHESEHGKWITMDELSLRESDSTIHWEMEDRHDRVMPLRNRIPPAWTPP